jgi:hypothetical protein
LNACFTLLGCELGKSKINDDPTHQDMPNTSQQFKGCAHA